MRYLVYRRKLLAPRRAPHSHPVGLTTVHALVLAAGGSRRFGSPKILTEFGGRPLIRHAVDAVEAALMLPDTARLTVSGVTVVLGPEVESARNALRDTRAQIVVNEHWSDGLSSSLRAGLQSLPSGTSAVLIALGDQALLDSADYQRLLDVAAMNPDRAVAARYQQTIGVPAVFPARFFEQLAALKGDRGAGSILKSDSEVVALDMPNAAFDIDTPEQLAAALAQRSARSPPN